MGRGVKMFKKNEIRDTEIVKAIDNGCTRKSLASIYGITPVRVGEIYKKAKRHENIVKSCVAMKEMEDLLRSIIPVSDDQFVNTVIDKFWSSDIRDVDRLKNIIYVTIWGIIGPEFIQGDRLNQLKSELYVKKEWEEI